MIILSMTLHLGREISSFISITPVFNLKKSSICRYIFMLVSIYRRATYIHITSLTGYLTSILISKCYLIFSLIDYIQMLVILYLFPRIVLLKTKNFLLIFSPCSLLSFRIGWTGNQRFCLIQMNSVRMEQWH